jgi:hypothetical protein
LALKYPVFCAKSKKDTVHHSAGTNIGYFKCSLLEQAQQGPLMNKCQQNTDYKILNYVYFKVSNFIFLANRHPQRYHILL